MPVLPAWLSADTPVTPGWAAQAGGAGPFMRPGLGTTAIGTAPLGLPPLRGAASPLRYGPFDLWPRLGYEVLYGNGLLGGGGGQGNNTWLNTLNPGFNLGVGEHWTIGYSPSIRMYSAPGFENTVNQSATLAGQTTWRNWAFRVDHGTALTSDPLIETAAQTEQTTHSTGLGASWDHGDRGALDFSVSQNLRRTAQFSDSDSWFSQIWYDYPWKAMMRVGVGVGAGFDDMGVGTDMLSERVNIRFRGMLTDKLSYSAGAGIEIRSFQGSGAATSVLPLANAGVTYQVLRRTALSGAFAHDVNTSYFNNEFTRNTSFQGNLTQGLSDRWSLSGGGGYRFSSYQQSTVGAGTAREDSSVFAQASILTRIANRTTASIFYSYRGNSSDLAGFSFDSHQVGLRLNWAL